ncbi:MAG: GtrA family protein [Desulfosarcina sp.]|nr:GtrA family protein [Desulfosarcina sp.]MBC2742462.1 GtrA family protein [Desulfosarcina sp.]MBC2765372.1 GtrA family protein [Desulfosarcina sp.]
MKIFKFFTSSVVGTSVDFLFFILLCKIIYPPSANIISAGIGMVTNYILQRRFVFNAKRSVKVSFILSLIFSICGILLGSLLIYLLIQADFFKQQPVIAKIITTIIIFFYNYQTKKFAFGDKKEEPVASHH